MQKYVFILFIIISTNVSHAKRLKENLCYKCYQSCLGKPKYNSLTPEEVVNFLKSGKLYVIKDYNNALVNADMVFFKMNFLEMVLIISTTMLHLYLDVSVTKNAKIQAAIQNNDKNSFNTLSFVYEIIKRILFL